LEIEEQNKGILEELSAV